MTELETNARNVAWLDATRLCLRAVIGFDLNAADRAGMALRGYRRQLVATADKVTPEEAAAVIAAADEFGDFVMGGTRWRNPPADPVPSTPAPLPAGPMPAAA